MLRHILLEMMRENIGSEFFKGLILRIDAQVVVIFLSVCFDYIYIEFRVVK